MCSNPAEKQSRVSRQPVQGIKALKCGKGDLYDAVNAAVGLKTNCFNLM